MLSFLSELLFCLSLVGCALLGRRYQASLPCGIVVRKSNSEMDAHGHMPNSGGERSG